MKNRISEDCRRSEQDLALALQAYLAQKGLPRKVTLGLKDQKDEWQAYGVGSSLEWGLLPSKMKLDPSWRQQGWWCDGVYFLTIEISAPNELRGIGYSWWMNSKAENGDIEPIEMELKLIETNGEPCVDYSIRLWADRLLHHITPSGIAVAPMHDPSAIQPDLETLAAIIRNPDVNRQDRRIAARVMERFAIPGQSLLIELKKDADIEVRRAVMHAWKEIGVLPEPALPFAAQALQSPDRPLRALAACALWQSADEYAEAKAVLTREAGTLIELLSISYDEYKDWDFYFQNTIIEALSAIVQAEPSIPRQLVELARKTPGIEHQIAFLLSKIEFLTGPPIEFLKKWSLEGSPALRIVAAIKLWALGADDGSLFKAVLAEDNRCEGSEMVGAMLEDGSLFKGMREESAIPVLLSLANGNATDPRLRCQAVKSLAVIAQDENRAELRQAIEPFTQPLINTLDHPNHRADHRVGGAAAEALGEIGEAAAAAIPKLVEIVRDEKRNLYLRSQAVKTLAKLKPDAETIVALFHDLAGEDEYSLHSEAIPLLSVLNADAAPVVVGKLLSRDYKGDFTFESDAFELLQRLGAAAMPGLVELIENDLSDTRTILSLGKTGSIAAVPPLIQLLQHESSRTREEAAEALGELGAIAAGAIPSLRNAIGDSDLDVCAQSVEALGRIGVEALPALLDAIEGADDFTLSWIAHALGTIGDRAAIPSLQPLRSHPDANVRHFAAEALRKMG